MKTLLRHSPCKINLLLNILGRRPDGFHSLETVLQPVPWCDRLEVSRAAGSGIELTCSLPTLPVDATNLVHRAATSFLDSAGIREGVRIHLEKIIPLAAGLGGGSGNAAQTLLGLNELFGQPLAAPQLHRLAADLGSDIPFFLQSQPALATGRGEIITPLAPFPALRGAHLLLIHPGFGISTAWAYQALARYPHALAGTAGRAQHLIDSLQGTDLAAAGRQFYNSLEAPALPKYPLLQLYQEFLRAQGASAVLMSGSGSTIFAVASSRSQAEQFEERFRGKFGGSAWTAKVPLAVA